MENQIIKRLKFNWNRGLQTGFRKRIWIWQYFEEKTRIQCFILDVKVDADMAKPGCFKIAGYERRHVCAEANSTEPVKPRAFKRDVDVAVSWKYQDVDADTDLRFEKVSKID